MLPITVKAVCECETIKRANITLRSAVTGGSIGNKAQTIGFTDT